MGDGEEDPSSVLLNSSRQVVWIPRGYLNTSKSGS